MSPARARTSTPEIVVAGRALIEAGGLEALTMQAVAERVGVRAPSLYKRFPDRGGLVAAIAGAALDELGQKLASLGRVRDPAAGLRSVAATYRAFAHANPRVYEVLFMDLPPGSRPPAEHVARASAPLLHLAERLVGRDRSLEAARLVTAFAHGFVSMELSGAFRLGGDVDEAYRFGVDVLVDALSSDRRTRRASRSTGRAPA